MRRERRAATGARPPRRSAATKRTRCGPQLRLGELERWAEWTSAPSPPAEALLRERRRGEARGRLDAGRAVVRILEAPLPGAPVVLLRRPLRILSLARSCAGQFARRPREDAGVGFVVGLLATGALGERRVLPRPVPDKPRSPRTPPAASSSAQDGRAQPDVAEDDQARPRRRSRRCQIRSRSESAEWHVGPTRPLLRPAHPAAADVR